MRGKVARSIRKISGYKPNCLRQYKKVVAAYQTVLVQDPEATEAKGETMFRLDKIPKYVWFHNDATRAVHRKIKKDYTKGRIK